jgi:TonB family protein
MKRTLKLRTVIVLFCTACVFAQSSTEKKPDSPASRLDEAVHDRPAEVRMGNLEIFTDTEGVDFGPYLQRVLHDVKQHWYEMIPQSAMPLLLKHGKVKIEFAITKTGKITGLRYVIPSGDESLDRAAYLGITASSPFPPLPTKFHGKHLGLRFTFLYNPVLSRLLPSSVQVHAGASLQFTPVLEANTDATKFLITWSVGGYCGAANCGTISQTGVYTAPPVVPKYPYIVVEAKADAVDEDVSAAVTIVPPDPKH